MQPASATRTNTLINKGLGKCKRSGDLYVPRYRSGSYGLLLALLAHRRDLGADAPPLSKTALMVNAQPYTDAPFSTPDSTGSLYTAWSSMSSLVRRGLVIRKTVGNIAHFLLTDAGVQLAEQLERSAVSQETDGMLLSVAETAFYVNL